MCLSRLLRPILIINLTLAPLIAHAQWAKVVEGEAIVAYADFSTVKNINNLVRVWTLYDYRTPKVIAGKVNGSIKTLQEFDCKEDRSRSLSNKFYEGQMGSGTLNHSTDTPTSWAYVTPNTVEAGLLKVMCKR